MKMTIIGFFTLFIFSVLCLGQTAPVSSPVASPVAASPVAPASLNAISSIVNKIPSVLPGWVVILIGFLTTLALRFWPTANPQSLELYAGQLLSLLGSGLIKISQILDQLRLQNTKSPTPPPAS